MQITELLNEGLKREIKVVVPQADLEAKMMDRLNDAKDKVQLKGFRPGKVPVSHLRKVYGKSFMAEVVNELVNQTPTTVLSDRGEKAATQPEVNMTEDEAEAEGILEGKGDFEFSFAYEVIPPIELVDFTEIKITRPVVDVPQDEIDEQVNRVAESARTYSEKKTRAEDKDKINMDYVGKIDGEAFEGGTAEGADLVLGSGQFIPGFEEQLVGVKTGDEKTITVTFPEDYNADHLAGKEARFDIKVNQVSSPDDLEINDELAEKLGLESAEKLTGIVKDQIESQYGQMTRQKIKRDLLDALDEQYQFEAPSKLIEAEFNNIWSQITGELERSGKTFADEDTDEETARADYQKLASRRVRLGLVLSEIGQKAEIDVSEDEMKRALFDQVRQYPGQENQIYEYFRSNPDAVAGLRAPIFEEKVVDHLLTQISITDQSVTKDELVEMLEKDADE